MQIWQWPVLAILVCGLCIAPGFSQETFSLAVDRVSRGDTITATTTTLTPLGDADKVSLLLTNPNGEHQSLLAEGPVSDKDKQGFVFRIPKDLAVGRYTAHLQISSASPGQPGQVREFPIASLNGQATHNQISIDPETGPLTPVLDSVSPAIVFPDADGGYTVTLHGSGFSPRPSDNVLLVSSKASPTAPFTFVSEEPLCWVGPDLEACERKNPTRARGQWLSSRTLQIRLKHSYDDVAIGLQIRVGEAISSPPYPITLSLIGYWTPALLALACLAVVAGLVLVLSQQQTALRGNADPRPQGLQLPSLLAGVLIDPQTNTYSLSRLQFCLWTLVAVFGYVYLFLARAFAQGQLQVIDIPDGWPGIVLISAGTSAFASGITNTKGSKGSGAIDPRLTDFLSAGGSIVPERLQFLVWTLIGAVTYLVVILFQNPGAIQSLPTLPQGFLELSGISSLGYLGGKLARKPGPVIRGMDKAEFTQLSTKNAQGRFQYQLKLVVNGSELSKDLDFEIETSAASPDQKKPTKLSRDFSDAAIAVLEPAGAAVGTKLSILISTENNEWPSDRDSKSSKYQLKICNPDGQWAAWEFDGIPGSSAGSVSSTPDSGPGPVARPGAG